MWRSNYAFNQRHNSSLSGPTRSSSSSIFALSLSYNTPSYTFFQILPYSQILIRIYNFLICFSLPFFDSRSFSYHFCSFFLCIKNIHFNQWKVICDQRVHIVMEREIYSDHKKEKAIEKWTGPVQDARQRLTEIPH